MLRKIKIIFICYELWALRWTQKIPLFGCFFLMPLFVWIFVPVMILHPFLMDVQRSHAVVGVTLTSVVALLGLAVVIPWLFEWYIMIIKLVFGRSSMALRKKKALEQRLQELDREA